MQIQLLVMAAACSSRLEQEKTDEQEKYRKVFQQHVGQPCFNNCNNTLYSLLQPFSPCSPQCQCGKMGKTPPTPSLRAPPAFQRSAQALLCMASGSWWSTARSLACSYPPCGTSRPIPAVQLTRPFVSELTGKEPLQ